MLTTLLRNAVARREVGVNVLLYGPPGSGRTALAAHLAEQSMAAMFAEAGALGGQGERLSPELQHRLGLLDQLWAILLRRSVGFMQ